MTASLTTQLPTAWKQAVITGLALAVLSAVTEVRAAPLQWAPAVNGIDLRWADADTYCQNLWAADHADWRLPTLAELDALLGSRDHTGFATDACCLWSATSLAQEPADGGGAPGARPAQYYWGLLVDGAVRYYSHRQFTDGQALCVRDTD